MKHFKSFLLLSLFSFPFIMNSQQMVTKSSLTGTDLPLNTKKESKSTILNTYVNRLDSFAIKNSFKVDKGSVEMLYTDADSLFDRFNKSGWTVTPIAQTSFYDITKTNTQLLAYVDYSLVLAMNKTTGGGAKINRFYYKKASVTIIRKRK